MLCFVITLFLCTVAHGSSASTTTVSVLVSDQSGGVIPGAKVKFKSNSRVFTKTTLRNGSLVLRLPLDHYSVSVTSSGLEIAKIPDFEARGSKMKLEIVLHVGRTSSPLVISDQVPLEPARLPGLRVPEP